MRAALALLVVVGCSQPHWQDARTDLDRVPLSVWAAGGGTQFVVGGPLGSPGDALFLRHDSSGWREIAAGTSSTLWWVFGLSAKDVWAVGEAGTVMRWDGSQLSTETVPTTETLFGIWGSADDDLWAVGGKPDVDGVLLHRSGSGWAAVTGLPNHGAYFKVWGGAADDVYVCGQNGTLLHWDGASWSPQPSGLMNFISLFTVSGNASRPGDVYAVGGLGNAAAVHLDRDGSWMPVTDKTLAEAPPLGGVAVASDGKVVMVGAGGTKLRGTPGSFSDETAQATRADFHAVTFDGSPGSAELWAVGGNWIAPPGTPRHGVIVRFGE